MTLRDALIAAFEPEVDMLDMLAVGAASRRRVKAERLAAVAMKAIGQEALIVPSAAGLVSYNFNEPIRVKLTDLGHQILRDRHARLKQKLPKIGDYIAPTEDADGFVSFAVWEAMHLFGPWMELGSWPLPIDSEVRLKAQHLKTPTDKT